MIGETRIIAFGASGAENGADRPDNADVANTRSTDSDTATPPWDAPADEAAPPRRHDALLRGLAVVLALAWTGFFVWSQGDALTASPIALLPSMITQWAVPLLLVAVLWLIAMRSSRREATRFGDAAAVLTREAATLEARLATVNGELSLAREFVAAQTRDLESLGRVAVERLNHNAERLQDLIRENGARVETIGAVSTSALENMDKLRAQLPVIASSAKDVTNHIGNAGRAAQGQLEELVAGFDRLNEFGSACDRQVEAVRRSVEAATTQFAGVCEDLDKVAASRFETLAQRGAEFRTRLETDEVEALAAIRTRAAALAEEIGTTRGVLDAHEEESLVSLRARLRSLRDEAGVIGRAVQDGEARAAGVWQARIAAFEEERAALEARMAEAEQVALAGMRERIEHLSDRSEDLQSRLSEYDHAALAALEDRVERLDASARDLQHRIAADEQAAVIRISAQLAVLDGGIAQRLGEHERHSQVLAARTEALTGILDEHGQRMAAVAQSAGEVEASVTHSLAALGERLTASRATLAATDGEVDRLTDASIRLLELIQASAKHSTGVLPEALALAEDRLSRAAETLSRLLADLDAGKRRGDTVVETIGAGHDRLIALLSELEAAQRAVSDRSDAHENEFGRLRSALGELERAGERVEAKTRDELGGAIDEVAAAVRRALDALDEDGSARVRALADRLGDESAQAIDRAMRPRVAEATGALEQAIAHASGAGREAAIQLRDQLATVNELVGSLESRVAQARELAQEQVDNDFSRRVALITDALNSNAIDIAVALSSDVSDTAWGAYLRGDRGIFTRRAVSLLDASESRAIQQLFERDDSFREHVSRYIHDFEAMLRQVLSTRDGNALGVTLLSSDMGKLYVALAQAIERLRS